MIEFIIIIPVLIFFLLAMVEYGRLFRENIWLAQTTYHTVVTGGENIQDDAAIYMPHIADRLYAVQNRDYKEASLSGGACNATSGLTCNYNITNRSVRVDVNTNISPLLHSFNLDAHVTLIGPQLVGMAISASALNSFANPNDLYNCDGTKPNTTPNGNCCGVDHFPSLSGNQDPAGTTLNGCPP